MKGSVSAEGNTLILTFDLDSSLAEYSDSLAESLNSVGKSAASRSMRTAATPTRCAL